MEELIKIFREHVIGLANDPKFLHYKWFVEYHLKVVEKISLELCDIYSDSDRNLVWVLVWIHDYGKILGSNELGFSEGKKKLLEIGFEVNFVEKVIDYFKIMERKMEIDLNEAPIEVKIISSTDGASHLIGPFYQIYFYENSNKDIKELMEGNIKKAIKDWDRKIVIPEVREAFIDRHNFLLEQNGKFPDNFFREKK